MRSCACFLCFLSLNLVSVLLYVCVCAYVRVCAVRARSQHHLLLLVPSPGVFSGSGACERCRTAESDSPKFGKHEESPRVLPPKFDSSSPPVIPRIPCVVRCTAGVECKCGACVGMLDVRRSLPNSSSDSKQWGCLGSYTRCRFVCVCVCVCVCECFVCQVLCEYVNQVMRICACINSYCYSVF